MKHLEKVADQLARIYVLDRDRHRCIFCGTDKELEWAHIITRGMGGGSRYIRWEPTNAVTLCHGDHWYFTEHPLGWKRFVAEKFGPDHWDGLLRMQAEGEKRGGGVDVAQVVEHYRSTLMTVAEIDAYSNGEW